MLLISPLTFSHELPTYWEKITETENLCEIKASFWQLTDSPFGYLIILNEEASRTIPMVQTEILSHYKQDDVDYNTRRIYESVSKGENLSALPTYTVDIPGLIESRFPTLIVSYSGRQIECDMDYWSDDEYSSSNVGSIGHGTK